MRGCAYAVVISFCIHRIGARSVANGRTKEGQDKGKVETD